MAAKSGPKNGLTDQHKAALAVGRNEGRVVRDYLEAIKWNKQPPVPSLPEDVVMKTREKYVECYERLTGKRFA